MKENRGELNRGEAGEQGSSANKNSLFVAYDSVKDFAKKVKSSNKN